VKNNACRELQLDEEEGYKCVVGLCMLTKKKEEEFRADIVMVKPAGMYLDIIAKA